MSRANVGFQNEGVVKRLSMTHGKLKPNQKGMLLQRGKGSKNNNKRLLLRRNLQRPVDTDRNLMSQDNIGRNIGVYSNHSNFLKGAESSGYYQELLANEENSRHSVFNLAGQTVEIAKNIAEQSRQRSMEEAWKQFKA